MVYNSPIDSVFRGSKDTSLEYHGTLDNVLSEMAVLSSTQNIFFSLDLTKSHIKDVRWATHPPRIIRAVIDYKIRNPDKPEAEALLLDAISTALSIYSNTTGAAEAIAGFRESISNAGLNEVLGEAIEQYGDITTWNALNSEHSQNTTDRLMKITKKKDLLFIALAHGGIAAGMDTYLRYCDASGSQNSAFYAVRFSALKLKDLQPKVSATEEEYLKKASEGRSIVLFDEDTASGSTITNAYDYFSKKVFPDKKVIGAVNRDDGRVHITKGTPCNRNA